MNLWASKGCQQWHKKIKVYPQIIAEQHVRGLEQVDAWYREEFPAGLAARTPPFITLDELEKVTQWKMKRGVWRERNRLLVAGNAGQAVELISREAFDAIPDPRKPIAILSRLAGVGPATASAILAALHPDLFPFFDELVAGQIPDLGPVAFTAPYYARYSEHLRERATRLTKTCNHQIWTANDLSQALWAASGGKAAITH